MGWAGLAAVLGAAVTFDDTTAVPGVAMLGPVAGTAAIVAAGARTQRGVAALLGRRPLARLGLLSYSWYLWHWPCLEIVRRVWAAPTLDDLPPPDAPAVTRLLAVAVSLGLAVLTFRYVEQPARTARLLRPVRLALPAGGALVAGTVAASVLLLPAPSLVPGDPSNPGRGRAGSVRVEVRGRHGLARSPGRCDARSLRTGPAGADACAADDARRPLASTRPRPAAASQASALRRRLPIAGSATRRAAGCVVLFGDSHAAHWFPALDAVARRQHWQLWFWAKSACGYADARKWLASYRREYTECAAWRSSALDRIAALPRVDLVVVGRTVSYLSQILGSDGRVLDRERRRRGVVGRGDAHVRAPVPRPPPGAAAAGRPPAGLRRPRLPVAPRSRSAGVLVPPDGARAHRRATVRRGAAGDRAVPASRWLTSPRSICPGDPCSTVSPAGAIVYRDEAHLTATFARESRRRRARRPAPLPALTALRSARDQGMLGFEGHEE